MTKSIGWELYRSFLAVLNHGSLSAAARALGITQPTVGRHVAELETSFKQTLFTRSRTGLLPTEAALSLRGYAEAMHSNAAALERAVGGEGLGIHGTVRVSASEVIAVEVLPPALARLRQQHPQLTIEVVATNRMLDLLQREADIAVRMTAPKQEQLIARSVGQVELGLYAHVDYLSQHGTPQTQADLAQHTLIGFDTETPFLREASKRVPGWGRAGFALRSDSDLAQFAMIRAGAGLGFFQCALASRVPGLVRVLPEQLSYQLDTWITMHEDLRGTERCKVTFDALVQCLLAHTN
ncbi:LysR family transcriptional regulator [Pseudomonas sp. N3-W]|uniref:LysR family transcriptional regulator n=1 Tax=Pseudomonas fungipugnans TaxID=3024217 RepID=A0ABT6QJ89_9PSED|nr:MULTISPECIES: LysR family transcriptional regulator [unclassified Pseudomonas]MDI2590354.1 LysR family transcriptional regulator [Pseudomonas sp. 681]UWF51943.1 LysR family transcriptional regulator [Pseudomonas sp. N3-W]